MHDNPVALKWSDDARAPTVVRVAVDILFDFAPCDVRCQRSGQRGPAALEAWCLSDFSGIAAL